MDWADCPPITKVYLVGALAASVAVQCHVVTPYQLYFTYRAAFEHGQLWRLVTNFLYFGPLSLDFFFHLFFFMRYSKMLEENTYHGHRADYAWLLIVCCTLLLLLSPLSPAPFLSAPLSFTWALSSGYHGVIGDLLGIAVGHFCFFTEIWKRELGSGEKNWLKTPDVLVRLIDGPEALIDDESDQE
ncbi:hypothetical protein PSHT_13142 [Puccinia striiformis]|uniref:Derlin n=1 Tax=Puccinia striiformis TaxID=27350 RepID=A0A2S4USM9_9BASI|nr:hypothetical protein PSHT_13142 [Puccinia striiformis]